MTALAAFILLLAASLIAVLQGVVHGDHFRLYGKVPAGMKLSWGLFRMVALAVVAAGLWLWAGIEVFRLVGLWASGLFVFPAVFRWAMASELRDKGWNPLYLGATAYYDRALLYVQLGWDVGTDPKNHYRMYHESESYQEEVHEAARLAYQVELYGAAVLCLLSTLL
jgi:hypothetical protein